MSVVVIENGRVLIDGVEHPELMLRASAPQHDWLHYANWRTSLAGAVAAVGTVLTGMIAADPALFAQWPTFTKLFSAFVMAGGISALGLVSKDSNKGSNIPEKELPVHLQAPTTPPTPVGTSVLGPVSQGPKEQA